MTHVVDGPTFDRLAVDLLSSLPVVGPEARHAEQYERVLPQCDSKCFAKWVLERLNG